jgi:hypothetical protein
MWRFISDYRMKNLAFISYKCRLISIQLENKYIADVIN